MQQPPQAPAPPLARLSVGVTGHRAEHPSYSGNAARIEAVLITILDQIDQTRTAEKPPFGAATTASPRLHSMLADGADQLAARAAIARGWELVAPLPFGRALNRAINAAPPSATVAAALLNGDTVPDDATRARAKAIDDLYDRARVFELADDDETLVPAFIAMHAAPGSRALADAFAADASERVALASRLVIEQSDFIIAIWDGARRTFVGGTGHTVATALDMGAAVIWIDAADPEEWRILRAPESLACLRSEAASDRDQALARLVRDALRPSETERGSGAHGAPSQHPGVSALDELHWRARSNPFGQAYRRIEALFGGEKGRNPWRSLQVTYETPDAIGAGSGANVLDITRTLPGADPDFAAKIENAVLRRFAWADGISSHLSDAYRGGMIVSFILSALAIVGGVSYIPFADSKVKWAFALFEFALLSAILLITYFGQRRRWHGRWFETRRVAEYLRHSPLLLTLGAARPPGRWPRGTETSWPEHYARHALREVGLPHVVVTPAYLRQALTDLLDKHVTVQRDYHHAKASKLTTVHRNLDRLSETLFQLAVVSVAAYLALMVFNAWRPIEKHALKEIANIFTFLGVLLPTFGGAIAGVRFFGDFERFAAISEVTAGKLDAVHARIALLIQAPDSEIDYGPVADLAHAADDIVVTEIENWQAVFGGKHITVPV